MARLIAGFSLFLQYASEVGAIAREEADRLKDRCLDALIGVGEQQLLEQQEYNPANRFCELLCSAISSDQAHIGGENHGRPINEEALGWEWSSGTLRSRGDCVGWLIEGNLYINQEAAMRAVNRVAIDNEGVNPNSKTMASRLHAAGKLASSDIAVEGRKTYKVRRRINGKIVNVLHLNTEVLGLDQETINAAQPAEGVAGRIGTR